MANPLRPVVRMLSGDKTVESRVLNLLGAQVLRSLLARSMYRMRSVSVDSDVQPLADELLRDGIVLIPNFLDSELFAKAVEESRRLQQDAELKQTLHHHGPNELKLSSLKTEDYSRYPAIGAFYQDRRLVQLMQVGEKRKVSHTEGGHNYEHLTQGPLNDIKDPEADLHSDIFYHTHKAWLYLDDVTEENGPLVAVKGSHHQSVKQLLHLYRESNNSNKGSRRVTQDELKELGLEETVITAPKNTLVVANVHGYHCRRRGQPGKERFALHWTLRNNPFRLSTN